MIDPENTKDVAVTGTGAIGALAAFWFWLRRMRRADSKEETVDDAWEKLVKELREELKRLQHDQETLRQRLDLLRQKTDSCEKERAELLGRVAAFERRYGTRKEGGSAN